MKKLLSLLLCAALLLTCAVPAFAELKTEETNDYPVIIVPGYAACALFRQNADGSPGEQVWGWNVIMDKVLSKVKAIAPELITGVGMLGVGRARTLGKTLGRAIRDLAWDLRCTPAGDGCNSLTTIPNEPDLCRWDHLKETYGSEFLTDANIGDEILAYIPETMLFNFYVDFRMGAAQTAEALHTFIKKVLDYTGKDKVNLYALSHGGQVTATYLSLYGSERDVYNAVLTVPAIGGAGFAYDFLSNNFALDEEELVRMIEAAMNYEQDFEWLVKAHQFGVLDDILNAAVPYAKDAADCWQSLWDFVPMDRFDALIETLDQNVYAGLIRKTTDYHRNVMANIGENLRKCRDDFGVNVSIMAGCGNGTVTGYPAQADAILTVNATTGAKCAPWGKRFADGYTCTGSVCTDPAHNHLSPSMSIDASYAYLPDNTWFIDGYFHGFTMNEAYTKELALTLLLTDRLRDVYTDKNFPQFAFSGNKAYSVTGCFDESPAGFLSAADSVFTVTNLSGDNSIRILSVKAAGLELTFSGGFNTDVPPHGSVDFTVSGDLPQTAAVRTAITITYSMQNALFPLGERTLAYTIDNGAPAAYDAEHPYCAADMLSPLAQKLPDFVAWSLKQIGLLDFYNILYNIFIKMTERLRSALPIKIIL